MSHNFDKMETWLVGTVIFISVTPFLPSTLKLVAYLILTVIALNQDTLTATRRPRLGPLALTVAGLSFGYVMDLTASVGSVGHTIGTNSLFTAGLVAGWAIARTIPIERMVVLLGFWATLFAGLSLVGVALYSFSPGIISSLPSYTYGSTHRTIGIANFLMEDGVVVHRNTGIASEPGLFQLVLNLGAVTYLRGTPELLSRRWLVGLLIIGLAIFETRSTAGLLIFSLILIFAAMRSPKILAFVALIVMIFGNSIRIEFEYQAAHKLGGVPSSEARSLPAQAILEHVGSSPLGVGTAAYNLKYEDAGWGSYDSYTQVLIRFGIPLALILGVLLMRNLLTHPLLTLTILMTFLSQPVWATPLVAYFYFNKPSSHPNQVPNRL